MAASMNCPCAARADASAPPGSRWPRMGPVTMSVSGIAGPASGRARRALRAAVGAHEARQRLHLRKSLRQDARP